MITTYGNPDASVILLQMADEHDLETMDNEAAEIQRLAGSDFCLAAFRVRKWNHDLSPWKTSAVFGRDDFGDGAADTLSGIMKYCSDPDKTYIIGGYSLAGLFALWAVCQTNVFRAAAAASPSVWFPGFTDYMKERRPQTSSIYLSLGDKEEKTRNPRMAVVGERIREVYEVLEEQGINTILEWNPGNHFKDPDLRMAKAFSWVMLNVLR